MTGVGAIVTVGILATVGAVVLKGFGFKGAGVFSAAAITVMLASAVKSASPIFDLLSGVPEECSPYAEAVIKAVGIGYATGITADICRELGEGGIAKAVLTCARIEIALVALPHLYEITELAMELIGGAA